MAQTKYTYSIADDTANAKVSDSLQVEIGDSAIITALDYISQTGDVLDIYMKDALSAGDETILDGVVSAHDGVQLVEPAEVSITQNDPDTGGLAVSPKWAKDGWKQQMFEIEFETSKLNSIHEKDINNVDIGWSSVKFYKDVASVETEWTPADQADLDDNCIRTDLLWMPDADYMIKGGQMAQNAIPSEDVYLWAVGADLDAIYGGPQLTFLEGGLNLAFAPANMLMGVDGVAASLMEYSHSVLGDGKGTNRIRFICRHSEGYKHRMQAVFEIFIDPAAWT
jgi:hypothetical protein